MSRLPDELLNKFLHFQVIFRAKHMFGGKMFHRHPLQFYFLSTYTATHTTPEYATHTQEDYEQVYIVHISFAG